MATDIAEGLVKLYNGTEPGETPGLLGEPYYFWEAGAVWDALIQYQNLTGDNQFNDIVSQALLFQQGESGSYMPRNQTRNLGNDDQSTWALAALSAEQRGLPGDAWLGLAVEVFNNQVLRWDEATCGGGLRWQIFTFNNGYEYKNSVSNGQFFQLASRLAQYTGNTTYSEWATKVFDWSTKVGLIDTEWQVLDGTLATDQCTQKDHNQWSSSSGTYITGVANMYNITTGESQEKWKDALDGLLEKNIAKFFPDGIATEPCEASSCNVDQRAFKGLLANQLVDTVRAAPFTSEKIRPVLISSAAAAAKACNDAGEECVAGWGESRTPTTMGVGEQLSALAYVQALLFWDPAGPESTSNTGNATTTATETATNSATGSPSGTRSPSPTATPNSGAQLAAGSGVMAISGIWAFLMLVAL